MGDDSGEHWESDKVLVGNVCDSRGIEPTGNKLKIRCGHFVLESERQQQADCEHLREHGNSWAREVGELMPIGT